jgi:hypothetical protein
VVEEEEEDWGAAINSNNSSELSKILGFEISGMCTVRPPQT